MKLARKKPFAVLAISLAAVLALSACGGAEEEGSGTQSAGTLPAAEAGSALDLSDVCPATVVLQQDWQPEAEHGSMYSLLADDYAIDEEAKSVSGSLIAGGVDTGVEVEVRPGGPNVGFQPVPALMYLDDSITLGAVNTDAAIGGAAEQPTVAVVSQLTVSPQILMWDPESHPGKETIADVVSDGATVVTSGDVLPALIASAVPAFDMAQSDTSYEGTPARFVSDPSIMQQGFITAEPYVYENEIAEWGKPVASQLMADYGYNIYPEPLAVRADKLEELSGCLTKLVPIMQQAQLDYLADPAGTNELIVELVDAYQTGWTYSQGVADFSVKTQLENEIVTNDPASGVFGQFDPERMQEIVDTFVPLLEEQGTITGADVKAEDLYTNEFIDTSISMEK